MSETTQPQPRDERDLRGTLGAVLFILVGLIALWDSGHISTWGGYIFPRTLAVLMIALSILLIVRNLVGFASSEPLPPAGSMTRRLGLVGCMLAAALVMPYLGFILTGVLAYIGIMLFAMYERWTPVRMVLYPIVGVVTVFAFHFLFDTIFLVPLPDGRLFW